jgi:hypothetical protein
MRLQKVLTVAALAITACIAVASRAEASRLCHYQCYRTPCNVPSYLCSRQRKACERKCNLVTQAPKTVKAGDPYRGSIIRPR